MSKVETQDLTPRLRESGYWGHNIIECARKFYALGQDEGTFEQDKADAGGYNRCYVGGSLEEVKEQVDKALAETAAAPILLEAGFHGFNLIEYGTRVFALSQAEGAFDYGKYQRNEYRQCYVAASINQLKKDIDDILIRTGTPRLVEQGFRGFNIIEYGPLFFALAHEEGAFDIAKFRRREYRRCVTAKTLDEVKKRLLEALETKPSKVLFGLASARRSS